MRLVAHDRHSAVHELPEDWRRTADLSAERRVKTLPTRSITGNLARMGDRRVFVEDWQMQCCGDRFEVGSQVSWTTRPCIDGGWLTSIFGQDAVRFTDIEDHHMLDAPRPMRYISGVVRRIRAVWCTFEESAHGSIAVAGSVVMRERTFADGWEGDEDDEDDEGFRFVGYEVDLDESEP